MQDKQKDRWAGWIKTLKYRERLQVIENHVTKLSSKEIDTSGYTPHDASHCLAVENMVKTLLEKSEVKLSDLEKFILFGAVWTHDLGMFRSIREAFFNDSNQRVEPEDRTLQTARERHDEISAWYLSSKYNDILKIDSDKDESLKTIIDNMLRNYTYTINVISRFHRMKEDINDCPKERFLKDEKIRTRLLACLLRLGDTLHVDSSRFDEKLYDILQIGQLDRSARLHWLKSYVVYSVYLDPKNETIFVNIDLPISLKSSQNNEVDRKEEIKNLESVIIDNLSEDALVVRETFKYYGFPPYDKVEPNISFIPGYSGKDEKEIKGMVSDLGVVFFPNTSRVIEKALDSITAICETDFRTDNSSFDRQMTELLSYLKSVLKDRPCHVGLRKIIGVAEEEFDKRPHKNKGGDISEQDITNCQNNIHKKLDKIRDKRKGYRESLDNKCKSILLNDFENIILFAYSETVTRFLDKYGEQHSPWKDRVKLYVLECGGKRRFTSSNNVEYNDGLYYAFQLSKHGFKKKNQIMLLPDTSFSSLAYNLKKEKMEKKSLVLFGVNGIDEKINDCGHTSGHLMVAIVAKEFNIPVKVIADSFKIGKIEWSPTLTRSTTWLTGKRDIRRDIKKHSITLTNYLEDRIPIGLIDEIIKDGENIHGGAEKRVVY
ncbi:MAG: hypothetical protein CHKLHMKO_00033 [Candidatus Argoarchaeum ethanivorans]|uniref:HD-CE domain-containing protein n=1 Tax=Candidatus Argoarchaeum ethanivorans TaxID=2608793 RepID=A0A811T5J0_9EURY|nr:MAG: hypothetical protein CHKLHMKO_00033 [Candidatus Argoarchaeum ethanivorans]